MFVEEERHQHSQHRHRRHRERNRNDQEKEEIAKTAVDDPAYPEARLEVILKSLEERVQVGREKLFKLQYQRSDLEFELKGVQEEKVVLDSSLAEAKQGEALVREKERQIAAEFKEITDGRQKGTAMTPSKADGLIKRTLILGRELFSLLLRDIAIEETARNAFQCRVTRIQNEMIKKAEERNQLQEKVIMLQTDCEVDLEQKRQIYDEVQRLQKRSDSFDAQISILTQWRKSLQNQITSVNVAIEERRNTVPDPIATSPLLQEFDDERGILPVHQEEEEQQPPPSRQASIEYSLASESPPPSPHYSSHDSELQVSPSSYQSTPPPQRTESEQFCDSIEYRQLQLKPYVNPLLIPSKDIGAFSPASKTKLELVARSKQQDGDEAESRTFDDSPESYTSDDSFLTMRTSRSVLFNLSSSTTRSASDADYDDEEKEKKEAENETNHSTSSDRSESPPFDYVLSQLHDVQALKIPTESSSTTSKTPFGFEIWREILPSEVSAPPSDLSKKKSKYEEKDGDEDDEMDDDDEKK